MDLNLINTYYPSPYDIDEDVLKTTRKAVVSYLSVNHPDDDFSPGTVAGDLIVGPMTTFLAASTIAFSRFTSDLDLENIANNIVWNCDFVDDYMANFSTEHKQGTIISGLVRFTFTKDAIHEVDKNVLMSFGDDKNPYRMRLLFPGPLKVLPAGSIPTTDLTNEVVLMQSGQGAYFIDVPVVGTSTQIVAAGSSAAINKEIEYLASVVAVTELQSSVTSVSAATIAKNARTTAYSATPTTKGGVRSYMHKHWSTTHAVSVISSGDQEMLRSESATLTSVGTPAIDIYYRSKYNKSEFIDAVPLKWHADTGRFYGELKLPYTPYLITDIVTTGGNKNVRNYEVFYKPDNKFPGMSGSFGAADKLYILVDPPIDEQGNLAMPAPFENNGDHYGMFSISYLADPMVKEVHADITSGTNAPVGVSVNTLGGPLAVIENMRIEYARQPGVNLLTQEAEVDIESYINSVAAPDVISVASIANIMRYSGADHVRDIQVEGTIYFTAADWVIFNDEVFDIDKFVTGVYPSIPTDDAGWDTYPDAIKASLLSWTYEAPEVAITEWSDLLTETIHTGLEDAPSGTVSSYAVTPNNIHYACRSLTLSEI